MDVTCTKTVFPGYLADPYVWRHGSTWYAVGTGGPEAKAGVFEVEDRAARAGVEPRLAPRRARQRPPRPESAGNGGWPSCQRRSASKG